MGYITSNIPARCFACLDAAVSNIDPQNQTVEIDDSVVADHQAVVLKVKADEMRIDELSWNSKYSLLVTQRTYSGKLWISIDQGTDIKVAD